MTGPSELEWVDLTPQLPDVGNSIPSLERLVDKIAAISHDITDEEDRVLLLEEELERERSRFSQEATNQTDRALKAMANLLIDLRKQGWEIRHRKGCVEGRPPAPSGKDGERERRRALLAGRRLEQLREPATRRFIQEQERGRIIQSGRTSIFELMRDGRELLDVAGGSEQPDPVALSKAVRPYVQFVTADSRCTHTGLRLMDIWRYFRHTWTNPYDSIPGRSLMLLIRDAGAPNHPIMGIAALGSAAVKVRARDCFIGWDDDEFLETCKRFAVEELRSWSTSVVQNLLTTIYQDDLIGEGFLSGIPTKDAVQSTIDALNAESAEARTAHSLLPNKKQHKQYQHPNDAPAEHWLEQARTLLFRSKRAQHLAQLLALQLRLTELNTKTAGSVDEFLELPGAPELLRRLVRIQRSRTVGTEIADLIVCGAAPPYNEMLAGKLVALLAVSPEVVCEYRRRYDNAASIIASSMAGARVVRPANLVSVSTTSLYGVRPSQYDRLSMPADVVGGARGDRLRYKFLESRTEGWGTFQFSKATKDALDSFLESIDKQRVRNIFGEGASPRLRALRDGLDALGLKSDQLLTHGLTKSVYAVNLAANSLEYLLGFDSEPQYLFDTKLNSAATEAIADWWAHRWAAKRIAKPAVRDRIRSHNLIHPIQHGARVRLPEPDVEHIRLLDE